jgi:hypothetical protein
MVRQISSGCLQELILDRHGMCGMHVQYPKRQKGSEPFGSYVPVVVRSCDLCASCRFCFVFVRLWVNQSILSPARLS